MCIVTGKTQEQGGDMGKIAVYVILFAFCIASWYGLIKLISLMTR